jgi:hypothetical protein
MATRRNITDRDIMELILESVSDAHSLADKDISAQIDSDTDSDTEDTDTNFTH